MKRHIILVGLSGVGKSSVGRLLAEQLGWPLLDSDSEIAHLAGRSVGAILVEAGEPAFRLMESGVLARACLSHQPLVIATGGGAILNDANQRLLAEHGRVVYLTAPVTTLLARFGHRGEDRPLLHGDAASRLQVMAAERAPIYRSLADVVIASTGSTWETAAAILDWLAANPAANIRFAEGEDLLAVASELAGGAANLRLISDSNVWPQVVARFRGLAEQHCYLLPPGEAGKSLAELTKLYSWLAASRAERSSVVLAVGGGAVGDVAGYAAASYLRGLRVVQVPTTLLAMVDASIGGKTAVNLDVGKNLVGAFHQPTLVLLDPAFLGSLPVAAYNEGWGEVCKYGMIEASLGGAGGLLAELEAAAPAVAAYLVGDSRLDLVLHRRIISRCAALKGQVVAGDEREGEGGPRIFLNYGHTIAHGLEKAAAYRLLHGNAVAVGMVGEAEIARRLGLCSDALVARQHALLTAYRLPTTAAGLGLTVAAVVAALALDKKVRAGELRWVLPTTPGHVTLHSAVPATMIAEVVAGLLSLRIAVVTASSCLAR